MKCHICAHEIPEGKKYCPGCGRVVRINEQTNQDSTMQFADPIKELRKAETRRPVSTDDQSTINIPDIFSTDPNAPEYRDPHAYDTATAHVLEYDRMFLSRSDDRRQNTSDIYDDDRTKRFSPVSDYQSEEQIVIQQEPDYGDDDYDNEQSEERQPRNERPVRKAGPKVNVKLIVLLVLIIAGLSICVMGVYRIGQQFGFWESNETVEETPDEGASDKDKLPVSKPAQTIEDEANLGTESDYETGVYTVKSDQKNIFVYKSVTDQRITATIPTGTVIEITEVNGELGKTTYNSYTGWVEMSDLEFTPSKEPVTEKETTTKAESASGEQEFSFPTTPGTYTVTPGSSTYLNVRASASTDSTVVGILEKGSQVEVTETDGYWGKISFNGSEAWIYMPYLK